MPDPHSGEILLEHPFIEAHSWLADNGPVDLVTEKRGTPFQAIATTVQKGARLGEPVIRFMQHDNEYARVYVCCWGHYHNCARTRIGMYCAALDAVIGQN